MKKYLRQNYTNFIKYIGIAYDERERIMKKSVMKEYIKYPLVEWGITEKQALQYCYDKGFDWGGLYDKFPVKRFSCWCCPLMAKSMIEFLRKDQKEKWNKLLEMQRKTNRSFTLTKSVFELDYEFWKNDMNNKETSIKSDGFKVEKLKGNHSYYENVKNRIIENSNPNDVIFDYWLHKGDSLIACEYTNRVCYGIETLEENCDIIVNRYINYVGNADNVYLLRDNKKIKYNELREENN